MTRKVTERDSTNFCWHIKKCLIWNVKVLFVVQKLIENSHLNSSNLADPRAVRADTSENIRASTSTSNSPWDGTDHGVTLVQWTTRVSLLTNSKKLYTIKNENIAVLTMHIYLIQQEFKESEKKNHELVIDRYDSSWKTHSVNLSRRKRLKKNFLIIIQGLKRYQIFSYQNKKIWNLPFASTGECTDCVVKHTCGIDGTESWATISVGQSLDCQELQVGGSWSWVRSLTPSWSNNVNSTADESGSKDSWSNCASCGDVAWSFKDRNVVGKGVCVVWWMVDNARDSECGSTSCSGDGSHDNDCVSTWASNSTMRGRNNPASTEQSSTAEMLKKSSELVFFLRTKQEIIYSISSWSQGCLVTELARWCGWSTNNATCPFLFFSFIRNCCNKQKFALKSLKYSNF